MQSLLMLVGLGLGLALVAAFGAVVGMQTGSFWWGSIAAMVGFASLGGLIRALQAIKP